MGHNLNINKIHDAKADVRGRGAEGSRCPSAGGPAELTCWPGEEGGDCRRGSQPWDASAARCSPTLVVELRAMWGSLRPDRLVS